MSKKNPLVSIVMGSQSDWKTLSEIEAILNNLSIIYEKKIISAHRTPIRLFDYAKKIENTSVKVIIAGAGGAAHLPGMIASLTHIPVLGVPIETRSLKGIDSLLSIVQMPAGIPVPTLAIGKPGAINAALSAAAIIGIENKRIQRNLIKFRTKQTKSVAKMPKN